MRDAIRERDMRGDGAIDSTELPAFGHHHLARQIVRRIERQFDPARERDSIRRRSEKALVVGVFGEWGSGKSSLLGEIHKEFERRAFGEERLDPAGGTLTLPVFFNPWRYEREEHLLVPLLKVTELQLARWLRSNPKGEAAFLSGLRRQARRGMRITAIAALSFASMFKGRVGIPGFGDLEVDPDAAIERAGKLLDREQTYDKDPLVALSSHYFDFERHLSELTRGRDGDAPRLNLLFFIDDLDRCLPEKAVEMLEAIKLFLDVEGCAFVLGLDDEVVERGIQHRYRDYLFQNGREGNSADEGHARPPITGAEYLEKIVHLPFRLPLPTRGEMRGFLEGFPLFAPTEGELRRSLLELFLAAVPLVPRKMVRAVELLELHMAVAGERGWQEYDPLTLARLTLLQLFAPELYRFARQRFPNLLLRLEEWGREFEQCYDHADFAGRLEGRLGGDGEASDADRRTFENIDRPLIALLARARGGRSGFDPMKLVLKQPQSDRRLHRRYFSLIDDEARPAGGRVAEPAPEPVEITDTSWLDLLFASEPSSWLSALSYPGLEEGKVLGRETFAEVLARAGEEQYRRTVRNLDWVEQLSAVLSLEQMQTLYRETGLLKALAADRTEGESDER